MPIFEKKSTMPASAEEVFAWHSRPGAFERLIPPWQRITLIEREGGIRDGTRLVMLIHNGPVKTRWEARHQGCEEGRGFADMQVSGPFKSWRHTHRFIPEGGDQSVLHDRIEYELRFGPPGRMLMGRYTEKLLDRMFRFRHQQTRRDLTRLRKFHDRGPQRIVISGASGLIGTAVSWFLEAGGHRVDRLVRREPSPGTTEIEWDPAKGKIDGDALNGADAVVHLSGESVAGGRWTRNRRERIIKSRTDSTSLLAETLAGLSDPPRVLISASAIGYYGDCAEDTACIEDREQGSGFLAEVCREWETAAGPAQKAGIRVANLRIGVVLAAKGGALKQTLLPFRLGLGGRSGSGRQCMSWVHIDDVVGAIHHLMFTENVSGPVNIVSPNPVANAEFTRTLAGILNRPTLFPMPAPSIKAVFGRMGEEVLLYGSRVEPEKLKRSGFEFMFSDLEGALREELGRWRS